MNLEQKLQTCPLHEWQMEQVVAFDWYDGARGGIARLSNPRCEFNFECVDERWNSDDVDNRIFRLSELPEGTVEAVVRILLPLGEAAQPVWAPIWRFKDEKEKNEVSGEVHALCGRFRRTPIVVLSDDMVIFDGVWSVPVDVDGKRDWFSFLGILPKSGPSE